MFSSFQPDQAKPWGGGDGHGAVYGTWAGETVTFQVSHDDGVNWAPAGADGILTDDGMFNFRLPAGVQIRFNVAGGSGAGLALIITGKIL